VEEKVVGHKKEVVGGKEGVRVEEKECE